MISKQEKIILEEMLGRKDIGDVGSGAPVLSELRPVTRSSDFGVLEVVLPRGGAVVPSPPSGRSLNFRVCKEAREVQGALCWVS